MKKIVFFSFLLAVSIWALVFIAGRKEVLRQNEEKPTVIESQGVSSSQESEAPSSSSEGIRMTDYRLRILTEPVGATIFLESENLGQSPFELSIPTETKKLRLTLEGYEDYERQVPAARDAEGDLVWKIQLKRMRKTAAPVAFYSKEIAPFSVQLKAVPLEEFQLSESDFKDWKVKFCRVEIDNQV